MARMTPISVTATSAVATNGTLTFGYPTRPGAAAIVTTKGDFIGSFGHTAYSRGLQYAMNYQTDFTLTFGNSNITFTYVGTSTIPANTLVELQLNTVGQQSIFDGGPYGIPLAGSAGDASAQANSGPSLQGIANNVADARILRINFGTPITSSATSVVNAATTPAAGVVAIPIATGQLDVPRTLIYKSSSASDTTTTTVTTKGSDEYNQPMTETIQLNGTSSVLGLKAFFIVSSYNASAQMVGNLSIGVGVTLGLPVFMANTGDVIKDNLNGATGTTGVYVAGVTTTPSATTGDVRGTYTPNTAPSTNTNQYESFIATGQLFVGAKQF